MTTEFGAGCHADAGVGMQMANKTCPRPSTWLGNSVKRGHATRRASLGRSVIGAWVLLTAMGLGGCACRDVTDRLRDGTAATYAFAVKVQMVRGDGTIYLVARADAGKRVQGEVQPSTRFKVKKMTRCNHGWGVTDDYATVLLVDGEHAGRTVRLRSHEWFDESDGQYSLKPEILRVSP